MLEFAAGGPKFHLPIRCQYAAKEGGLCSSCLAKQEKTLAMEATMRGMTTGVPHPTLLHGRIGGPIPFWSHLFGSAWWRLKLEEGYTISDEVMAKAKKVIAEAGDASATATAIPETIKKRGRKPKVPGAPAAAPATALQQTKLEFPVATGPPVIAPSQEPRPAVAVAAPAPAPKKRAAPKKSAASAPAPVATATAFVDNTQLPEPVEDIVKIRVRKIELDGRNLYVDPKKQKVYDLKFKYVGRFDIKAQRVDNSFPDSDAE